MTAEPTYIVDSDVFITAKDRYYAFDLCPGFWDSIVREHHAGRLRSIDRVRQELLNWSEEELIRWIKNDLPPDFFLDTSEPEVARAFGEVMLWVTRSPQYFGSAKAAFATKADGWLVAYGMVRGVKVATNELSRPGSRNEVKLGDACLQFGVKYEDTFEMLRALQVHYEFRGIARCQSEPSGISRPRSRTSWLRVAATPSASPRTSMKRPRCSRPM